MISEVYLYKISNWILKYHISYPASEKEIIKKDIKNLIYEIENSYIENPKT